jgi:2,5-furandicarboxylate decarboxylase 1
MPDQSLRTYLGQLEQAGKLERIEARVDVDRDVSALSWQTWVDRARACLFTTVDAYPDWQIVSQLAMDRDMWGTALGVPPEVVVSTLADRLTRPIAPVEVDSAPVHEIVQVGDEVDLASLPAMWTSERDPGRYIASGMGIIKNPETGIRNMSIHRAQVFDRNRTGYYMLPRQAMRIHRLYEAKGRPMEVAMVIGAHPLIVFASAFVAPFGVDELAVAGGLLGEPVRMVKCRTIDVEVPADAEIVLEGEILPGEVADEGPFGEVTGTYSKQGTVPVFRIKAITRRRKPIFHAMTCGMAPSEAHAITCAVVEAKLWDHLAAVDGGLLDLHDIRCPGGMSPLIVAVGLRPRYAGQTVNALLAAASSPYLHPKFLVGLDADVDAGDSWAVLRALAARLDPVRGITRIDRTRVFTLDNASPLDAGGSPMHRVGTKVLFDTTLPVDLDAGAREAAGWIEGASPVASLPARTDWLAALGVEPAGAALALAARFDHWRNEGAAAAGQSPSQDIVIEGKADDLSAEEALGLLSPLGGTDAQALPVIAIAQVQGSGPAAGELLLVRVLREGTGLQLLLDTPRQAAVLVSGLAVRLLLGAGAPLWLAAACGTMGARATPSLATALAAGPGGPAAQISLDLVIESPEADAQGLRRVPGLTGSACVELAARPMRLVSARGLAGSVPGQLTRTAGASPVSGALPICLAVELLTAHHLRNVEGGLDLREVLCPAAAGGLMVVLQLAPRVAGQAKTALMAALSGPSMLARCAIAVDPDVNADDPADLIWALGSRTHAPDDLTVLAEAASLPVGPHARPTAPGLALTARWLCDCTVPLARVGGEGVEAFARATPRNNDSVDLSRYVRPKP